jgi:hypothetical protein
MKLKAALRLWHLSSTLSGHHNPARARGRHAARLAAASSGSWASLWYSSRCWAANRHSSARSRRPTEISMGLFARPVARPTCHMVPLEHRGDREGLPAPVWGVLNEVQSDVRS